MSKSASGQVVDEQGAALPGVTVVLDDVSALFSSNLGRTVTDQNGRFRVPDQAGATYDADSAPELGPRRIRVELCVGRHMIKTQEFDDVTTDLWQIPALSANRVDATSWWATLNTGAVSRKTDGNAVRWLVDDVDAWSALATEIQAAQASVNVMQLHLDVNDFDPAPDNEKPSIVLAFRNAPFPRKVDPGDVRIERLLLNQASRGVTVRVQIPSMSLDSHALPIGLLLAGGLAALAFIGLLVAVVALLLLAAGLVWLNHYLRNAIGNPDAVIAWFNASGHPDVAKTFPGRLASIVHAKIVTVDDKVAFLLGSPFIQGYYDSSAHLIDEPRRGLTADTENAPIHDVSAALRGPAIGHVKEVFNQHWNLADTAANLPVPPALPPAVVPDSPAGEVAASVQIVRTLDAGLFQAFPDGEKGVLEAYLRAIAKAQRFIYFENQYFTHDTIIDALVDALLANTRLQLVLVLNIHPDIPMYPPWQRAAVKKIQNALGANVGRRFAAFTTWSHAASNPPGHPKPRLCANYVHAKAAIIDDRWATVGSANLDGASLDYFQVLHALLGGDIRNSEANCVVFEDPAPAVSAVDKLRRRLWAEHLGLLDATGAPDPTNASLADQPASDWVSMWTQAASGKLQGLIANPNAPTPVQVLPWAIDHTKDSARDYLEHLFKAQGVALPDLDLVKAGPPSFDFQAGNWKKP